jgi:type IV pilus assembly protein PilC
MPEFILRVGTPEGDVVERQVQASSLRAAREEMSRQGMHVFEVKRGTISFRDFLPRLGKTVPTEKFLLFNQELLALVRAGLPIVQSLDILLERQKNARFREVLADVREKITSGVALSDAFASYGDMFPPIYSTSLRAGERSGDLEGVIKRFLRYQKMIVNLRKRVVGAMVYPVILVTLSVGMIVVMMTMVIPKFADFFAGFGAQLPWFTVTMINIATLMRNYIVWILIGAAAAAVASFRDHAVHPVAGHAAVGRDADGAGHRDRLAVGHEPSGGDEDPFDRAERARGRATVALARLDESRQRPGRGDDQGRRIDRRAHGNAR